MSKHQKSKMVWIVAIGVGKSRLGGNVAQAQQTQKTWKIGVLGFPARLRSMLRAMKRCAKGYANLYEEGKNLAID